VTTKSSSGTITSPSKSSFGEKSSSSIASVVNENPTSDSTLKPGRLTVQIYEAKGLSLPPGVNRPNERPASSSSLSARGHDRAKLSRSHLSLPYIVLEFDKNQVLLETNYGELTAPVWGRGQDLYRPLVYHLSFGNGLGANQAVMFLDRLNSPRTSTFEQVHTLVLHLLTISTWGVSK
jgi:hypothetical protein